MMKLADPQEIENFLIKVIQDFNLGWFFVKEDLSAAAERFDIAGMLRDERNYFLGYAVFAA